VNNHDGPICASIGHYVASLVVAWCGHDDSYTVVVNVGDDTDDTLWRSQRIVFGPFDSRADVLARLESELGRIMRADLEAYKARRAAGGGR
jgi:hypothetical protein